MYNLLKNQPTKCLFYVYQTTFNKMFAYEKDPTKLFSTKRRWAKSKSSEEERVASNRFAEGEVISKPQSQERRHEGVSLKPEQPERSQEGVSRVPQLQTELKSDFSEDRRTVVESSEDERVASKRVAAGDAISGPQSQGRRQEGISLYPEQPERSQEGVSCVPQLQTAQKSDISENKRVEVEWTKCKSSEAERVASKPQNQDIRREGVSLNPEQPERSQKGVSRVTQLQIGQKSDISEAVSLDPVEENVSEVNWSEVWPKVQKRDTMHILAPETLYEKKCSRIVPYTVKNYDSPGSNDVSLKIGWSSHF